MSQLVIRAGDFTFDAILGQLAGNTLTSGLDRLAELGKTVLWKGAQKVRFEAACEVA